MNLKFLNAGWQNAAGVSGFFYSLVRAQHMKGWIRLGIVLSGFWIAGVLVFVVAEFIARHPEACVKAETFLDTKEFFFSCNRFADLVPDSWNRFLLEFNTKRFLLVWLGPVVLSWLLAVVVFQSWRWVARGFRK